MLIIPPPKSNAERQREFRERNPGYYGRLHRKRKAEMLAYQAALLAAETAAKEPLMLPAPAETIRIPGVNAIPTRAEMQTAEPIMAARSD